MNAILMQRAIKQHIWGPAGSVLFHSVVVAMLLLFAIAPKPEPLPEVGITIIEPKADVLEKVLEQIIEPVVPPEVSEVRADITDVAVVNMADSTADMSGSGEGNSAAPGIGSNDAKVAPGFEIASAKSPLVFKNLYEGRTAKGRGKILREYGCSPRGEVAVLRALRWFKANQSENGSWDKMDGHPLAFSGLAVLAFLAHGETPESIEFGQTVEKALKYIVSRQDAKGMMGEAGYEHAICTYAISEGFGLTRIMALKDAMDKGINIIIEGQQPGGGYDYNYAKNARWDLSVAGWQFQALKAASMAGCSHPKLENAISKGMDFLTSMAYDPKTGGFGYDSQSSTPSMTSAGTLCLQLMGKPNAPQVRTALKYIEELPCVWAGIKENGALQPGAKPDPNAAKQPVYTWYYATQAKSQKGEKDWASWDPRFSKTLIQNQIVEGPLGHWQGGDHGGAVYTTALCCLMLEVYYRHLPTYKHVEAEKDIPAAPKCLMTSL